jgi:MEMO1 family protein
MIDDLLAKATPPPITDGTIIAAVAPHAGYPYSGPVAAYTYAALKGHKYSRVVVIAPSHYEASTSPRCTTATPTRRRWGTVPVDKEFARQLVKMSSTISSPQRPRCHWPAPEHSPSKWSCRGCRRCWATLSWCPS